MRPAWTRRRPGRPPLCVAKTLVDKRKSASGYRRGSDGLGGECRAAWSTRTTRPTCRRLSACEDAKWGERVESYKSGVRSFDVTRPKRTHAHTHTHTHMACLECFKMFAYCNSRHLRCIVIGIISVSLAISFCVTTVLSAIIMSLWLKILFSANTHLTLILIIYSYTGDRSIAKAHSIYADVSSIFNCCGRNMFSCSIAGSNLSTYCHTVPPFQ